MNERKLLFQNPAALLFLGAVPALGASADLRAALGMSAAVLGVLLLSALILGLLRNLIPSGARLPAALLVVAGCASAAQLLLHALLPSAWEMLGFYAAVLAVDLMLFASAEDALDFPLGKSLCSALISGLIFAVFVLLLAAIRELFGAASICGNPIEALAPYKIPLLTKTTGGLFVFAILLAVVNRLFPAQAGAGSLSRAAAGLSDGKEA
jgi:Na+-translocating ferredoxin:NAD+ oxidoreductase RnfE subunit